MADFDDLDTAFRLPEIVDDTDLRALFERLRLRLQEEATAVPMSTAQILRGERMITEYIRIKWRESKRLGDVNGYQHAGQEKDANLAWRSIAKDWDDIFDRAKPGDRAQVLAEVKQAIVEVLGKVEDAEQRTILTTAFVAQFDRLGI